MKFNIIHIFSFYFQNIDILSYQIDYEKNNLNNFEIF